jgi:hypothetical protein
MLRGFLCLCASSAVAAGSLNSSAATPALAATAVPVRHATLKHSISGISSGGGMVANHLVAYSTVVEGAAIVAGNPYGCGNLSRHADSCNTGQPPISLQHLYAYTAARERAGLIDATANLKGKPLYLYSGVLDSIVSPRVMDRTQTFFNQYVGSAHVTYVDSMLSEHGYITDNYGECCSCLRGTFILNCQYDQPGAIFRKIYGKQLKPKAQTVPAANLKTISQKAYAPKDRPWSQCMLLEDAYVYVPTGCAGAKVAACRVHVNYHGCGGAGLTVPRHVGYNVWGEANDIVVVYPQASSGPGNPTGCW